MTSAAGGISNRVRGPEYDGVERVVELGSCTKAEHPMSDGTWTVEPRPVPVELEHGFDHATFPAKRVEWATFADQLSAADKATLHLLMNGGTGDV